MVRKSNGPQVEQVATHSITIAGQTFNVPVRYSEGHVLTAGEANALKQTMQENVRNNLASKAKARELTQEMVNDYAANYRFGERTGGFASGDPIEQMAMIIARRKVKGKGLSAAQITEAARELLTSERGASIRKAARAMVEA